MKQLVSIPAAVIYALLTSSSVAGDSVFAGDNEWLQPADFLGYPPSAVAQVCPPPSGLCSGFLSGSNIDLTGYTWASLSDVIALFNDEYDAEPPITSDSDYASFSRNVLDDFLPTFTSPSIDLDSSGLRALGVITTDFSTATGRYSTFDALFDVEGDSDFAWFILIGDTCPNCGNDRVGAWFWREAPFKVHLEEPVKGQVHSGIGSLRGWAIAEDGIDRVEVYIDGNYAYDAPYGGPRGDVEEKFPEIDGSGQSGFSMAFSYSNLSFGQHTITVLAFDKTGSSMEATSTFDVVTFDKKFISKQDVVDATGAEMLSDGDEIYIQNILIDDRNYDLTLKWRTSEQGFEIVEIR